MPPVGQADVASLSDEELSDMLKELGVDVGPINVATRKTYENKLVKLSTGLASPPSQYAAVEDDDDEDNEVILKKPVQKPVYQTPPPSQPRQRREVQESHIPTPRGDMSRPSLYSDRKASPTYARSTQPVTSRQQQQQESSGGGIPAWVKLTVVAVVVLLLYLIYTNMEPNAVSNIPSLPPKVEV